jgi:YaiO family outer membrane protein
MSVMASGKRKPDGVSCLILSLLSCALFGAGGVAPVYGQEAGAEQAKNPLTYSLELGLALGHYPDETGHSEFVSLSMSRPFKHLWRFFVSHDKRFGDSGLGLGASYSRYWSSGYNVSIGVSTGTSDALHPEYAVGVSAGKNVLSNLSLSLSYARWQSKDAAYSDAFMLGTIWYATDHWMIGSGARFDLSHPGEEWSRSGDLGITYFVYRQTYVEAGVTYADVAYLPSLIHGSAVMEYTATSYRVSFARFLNPKMGFSVRFDYSPFWDSEWLTVKFFRDW